MKQLHLFKSNDEEPRPHARTKTVAELIEQSNPLLGPESKPIGYSKYLASEEWRNKRAFALYKADYTCHRCGRRNNPLEVHHKHYNTLYRERLGDVEVLCVSCHPGADEDRRYFSAYETWAYKIYGDNCDLDSEWLQKQFNEWYEERRHYDDEW